MSFFDKVKQSASEAAKKAQQTVEITKLRGQIAGKEKDMEQLFRQIGETVYQAHASRSHDGAHEEEVAGFLRQLDEIRMEIDMLEERIKHIRSEKSCACGKVVSLDTRYCPDCGSQLAMEEPKPVESTMGEIRVVCSHCGTENDLSAQFCVSCGSDLPGSAAADATEETERG
ncbi:zinc ribbon domain-containing protein [Paenibacillus methanolicus]|uniref:Double zinc ribbon protein n=1 Tax=Paenibacillus methanolicus TaxID=582686 RepID=A0A5S5BVN9_9BACL|nr:zinc ribbon domain-containing protein [Paenibacillus methanolicus]TYP70252.1 double zinc ribbon protein [Paenibacillus methanolicus]